MGSLSHISYKSPGMCDTFFGACGGANERRGCRRDAFFNCLLLTASLSSTGAKGGTRDSSSQLSTDTVDIAYTVSCKPYRLQYEGSVILFATCRTNPAHVKQGDERVVL